MSKTSGTPLISIVGFTDEEVVDIKAAVKKAGLNSKDYLYIPLPPNGKYEYTDKYIINFFEELKKRIIKYTNQKKDEYATPGYLNLIYVSQYNEQKLTNKCYKIFKTKKIDRPEYKKYLATWLYKHYKIKSLFKFNISVRMIVGYYLLIIFIYNNLVQLKKHTWIAVF